jgi:signal transduction histidine kinase/PAS domain-containing protein
MNEDDPAPAGGGDEDDVPPVSLTCGSDDTDDTDGRITSWNAAAAAAAGREHLADVRFDDLLATEEPTGLVDAARRNGDATVEAAFASAPGVQYDFHATRLVDGSVSIHGTATTPPDPLEESWVDRVTDAFFAVDDDWQLTYVNEEAREVLATAMGTDYSRQEMLGRDLWTAIPDAVGTTFYEQYHEAMASQEPAFVEEYYEPLDAYIEVRAFPSESGLSVYFRDVTERRERLETLENRERVLRRLYEVTSEGDRSFEDRVETLLSVGCEFLDVDYGTLSRIDGDDYEFEYLHAPPDADLEAGDVVQAETTNCERAAATEQTLVLADVERDAPELAGRSGNADGGISSYLGAPVLVEGDVYGTFCFYDMEARDEPFTDWEVTVVDLMSQWVANELTDRRIRDRLQRQNDRLEDFASIVSHDLRNPLNVLSGSLELAAETGDPEDFQRCRRAVDRMEALVDDLLELARSGEEVSDRETVDLAAVAEEVWRTVETDGAALDVRAPRRVSADRSRLQQLLSNLFRNAVEHGSTGNRTAAQSDGAVEHGSRTTQSTDGSDPAGDEGVVATGEQSDEDEADGLPGGPVVTVTLGDTEDGFYVADDGPGIPDSERADVFEHGFTTSADGTGFGLSIVADVADAHGWTVSVTESDAGGARFEFSGVDAASDL